VALRCPEHPLARRLIATLGGPLAAPSANRSTQLSPTTAGHVLESLGNRIDLILDGGPCCRGIESTVVDCTTDPPRILRPGPIGRAELEAVLGGPVIDALPGNVDADTAPARSPGQLARHYAPKTPLEVSADAAERVAALLQAGKRVAWCADFGGMLPLDPEVGALCQSAALGLEKLGCAVEEACFDASDLTAIVAGTRGLGMVGRYAHRVEAARGKMTAHLLGQVDDALRLDLKTVTEAERLRTRYWHRVRAMFERFDYIATPAIGAPAFLLDEPLPSMVGTRPVAKFYDAYRYSYAFSVVGLPVVAVPCGFTREGLPVGLQIAARRLNDEAALAIAAAFLAAHPDFLIRPSTLL
jgi:Asp-tRNA(Asn)/Glu-tRNA(Gln) amidotransferase A subunit family amidase